MPFSVEGKTLYATHGHIFNQDNLPPMQEGDILIHGHTHLLKAEETEGDCGRIRVLNPGSVSIPKEEIRIHMVFWRTAYLPSVHWTVKRLRK